MYVLHEVSANCASVANPPSIRPHARWHKRRASMASAALSRDDLAVQASTKSATEAAEKKSRGDWFLGLFFILLVREG